MRGGKRSTHKLVRNPDGSYLYRGFGITKGYDVLGAYTWLVHVEMGTLSAPTLADCCSIVDGMF